MKKKGIVNSNLIVFARHEVATNHNEKAREAKKRGKNQTMEAITLNTDLTRRLRASCYHSCNDKQAKTC